MLFKYHFIMEELEKGFSDVENSFMNHLQEFNFIDSIDYDGEFITLLVSEKNKQDAVQKEDELNAKMKSLMNSYCAA